MVKLIELSKVEGRVNEYARNCFDVNTKDIRMNGDGTMAIQGQTVSIPPEAITNVLSFFIKEGGTGYLAGRLRTGLESKNAHDRQTAFETIEREMNWHIEKTIDRTARRDPFLVRLVSTTDGPKVRAIRTDGYTPYDNATILAQVLPVLEARGYKASGYSLNVVGDLHLRVVSPDLVDVSMRKVGDFIRSAMHFGNSEVGNMALRMDRMVERLVCLNGMVVPSTELAGKVRHIGSVDHIRSFVQNGLIDALKLSGEMVSAIQKSHDDRFLPEMAEKIVLYISEKYGWSNKFNETILTSLQNPFTSFKDKDEVSDDLKSEIMEYQYSKYGIIQAITHAAQEKRGFDRLAIEGKIPEIQKMTLSELVLN